MATTNTRNGNGNDPRHSEEYKRWINSEEYRDGVRRLVLERDQYRCQWMQISGEPCRFPYCNVEVHHFHYRTLGFERTQDLITVCYEHHKMLDEQRREDVRQVRLLRGCETFAEKKYGANWRDHLDEDEAMEEFRWFLESQPQLQTRLDEK